MARIVSNKTKNGIFSKVDFLMCLKVTAGSTGRGKNRLLPSAQSSGNRIILFLAIGLGKSSLKGLGPVRQANIVTKRILVTKLGMAMRLPVKLTFFVINYVGYVFAYINSRHRLSQN